MSTARSRPGPDALVSAVRWFDRWIQRVALVGGVLLIAVAGLTTYEVVVRKLFTPSSWIFDTALLLYVWAVFLGFPYSESSGSQIAVDIFDARMPDWLLRLRERVYSLMGAVLTAFVGLFSTQSVAASIQSGERTNTLLAWPVWIIQLAVPVGVWLLFVRLAVAVFVPLARTNDEREEVDPVESAM